MLHKLTRCNVPLLWHYDDRYHCNTATLWEMVTVDWQWFCDHAIKVAGWQCTTVWHKADLLCLTTLSMYILCVLLNVLLETAYPSLFLPVFAVISMSKQTKLLQVIYKPHHSLTGTASEAHARTPDWKQHCHTCPQLPGNRNILHVFKITIQCT